jgi:hypothetical protein
LTPNASLSAATSLGMNLTLYGLGFNTVALTFINTAYRVEVDNTVSFNLDRSY